MATADSPSPEHGRIVHEIQWSEALPWWILFRAAGTAFAPTVILLALLGSLATWAGWSIADSLKLAGGDPAADAILDAELAGGGGGGLVLPAPGGSAGVARPLVPSR